MPTLITTQPVTPAAMPIVHAAQAARWTVHRTTGGRLPEPASDETAMYGEVNTLLAVAQLNRLNLLSPGPDWITELPSELSAASLLDDKDAKPEFEYEIRCFIGEGTDMTCSPMRHLGKSCRERGRWVAPEEVMEDALTFCDELLENPEVFAPPAFALDVGLVADQGWVAVEAHPCWAAEVYSCSPSSVLQVLLRSCRTGRELSGEDSFWLID